MSKNEIINKIVDKLLKQREDLNYEIANLNCNEPSFFEKKSALEFAISNIDMQLDRRVAECEITPIN